MKKLQKIISSFILLILAFSNVGVVPTHAAAGDTTRVSVASDGSQANGDAQNVPSISADGRYVAFDSFASNLVNGDTNNFSDIFVHDRTTSTTARVSVSSNGTQTDNQSYAPSISADGHYVAFFSAASNLISGDTNNTLDIFVHDRLTGTTTRASVASDGTQSNDYSYSPSISADGRYVAFFSAASNLVSGDTNNVSDIFVHDRNTGATTRVSVASDGTQANSGSALSTSISADGRYVVFASDANNLVSGDTNGQWDIFVHDRVTSVTTRVSVDSNGTQSNAAPGFFSVSADGRYVAFDSFASNLVSGDTNFTRDIFVHDRTTSTTTRVSVASDGTQANGLSYFPSISADGRFVAFSSYASNLVNGDTNNQPDVFMHDRITGTTTRVSVASDGTESNGGPPGLYSSISADGRYAAFDSDASNLVSGDTNNAHDIFVHELDITAPTVTGTNLTATYTGTGPGNFTITFSKNVDDPAGNTGTDDVTNTANYLLVNKGANGTANTASCLGGVGTDDTKVAVNSVSYDNATFTATVTLASALPVGSYRLFVCGTTSIVDAVGIPLNGGTSDYTFDFVVNAAPTVLPATGFPQGRVTNLPEQPASRAYAGTDLVLEIPSLNQKMAIVGVPQTEKSWDITWLGNNAGWLEGSAFPTWSGNTVLTGHVWDSFNRPGPFVELKNLEYGDQILIHAFGLIYTYEVRESKTYWSKTAASKVFQHEELDWVTLITCETYNPLNGDYFFRRAVRAVLVSVK